MEVSKQPSIFIEANLEVLRPKEAGWENFAGIQRGMRPTLFVDGYHYICIIEASDGLIEPGASGKVTLCMPTDELSKTDTTAGSRVEMRAGAAVVGIAEIPSMKKIS
ncbi:MAG: hypothetical protein AAGD92_16075 [Pseudomonadota bacterium]